MKVKELINYPSVNYNTAMQTFYSKKALIYLEGNLRSLCGTALEREGYDSEVVVADSPEAVVKAAEEGILLSFIRSQLLSMIERNGIPGCIVIAFPSRYGIAKEKDPDGSLLMKAILLACIMIGLEHHLADARFHLLILSKGDDRVRQLNDKPEKLLALLNVEKEDLKFRIDNFINDKALLARNFLFKTIDSDRMYTDPYTAVKGFLQQIDARFRLEKKVTVLSNPLISTKNDAPANVLYLAGDKLWMNGSFFDSVEEAEGLDVSKFHITGSLTTKNIKSVLEIIKNAIKDGISNDRFSPDKEIVITLGEKCVIDATAATAFAQLMVTDLARFKKKKILVSSMNDGIMRKSTGYTMIREYVRVDQY
jgi:hypothetical protein